MGTAERGFVTADDAVQNAALFAMLYLEGGFGPKSPYCRITPVGLMHVPGNVFVTPRPAVTSSADVTRELELRAAQVGFWTTLDRKLTTFVMNR